MNYRRYFSHRLPPQTGILPHPRTGSHMQRRKLMSEPFHARFKHLMKQHILIGT